eukprot:s565_g2.t1
MSWDNTFLKADFEASWRSSSKAIECYDVSEMIAVNENVHTGLPFFRCLHHATNCNIATFRAGDADVWEEVACMHLWVDLINIAQTCDLTLTLGPFESKFPLPKRWLEWSWFRTSPENSSSVLSQVEPGGAGRLFEECLW